MSTDAFFFFHMDPDNRCAESPNHQRTHHHHHHQPAASTSSSSVVSSRVRRQFLVDYSPKAPRHIHAPAFAPQPRPAATATATATATTSNSAAIHRWLAGQQASYSYLPHSDEPLERSSFSDSEEEEEEEEEDCDDSDCSSSDEEDQIYLRPRRQHSAPSIPVLSKSPVRMSPTPKKSWPLTAPKPAMPVVDLSEATAFANPLQDKSHWSDDESEGEERDSWEGEEEEDLDLPPLVPDQDQDGAPASTSTRSIPIPTRMKDASVECYHHDDLDALWDCSYQSPVGRRAACKVQDGQSFYAPFINSYLMAAQRQ